MQPIIGKFKERPKTSTAWWAMGLGIGSLFVMPFLGIMAAVVVPYLDTVTHGAGIFGGFMGAIIAIAITFAALVTTIRAYRKGERSWVMWLGLIPALLTSCLWIVMIAGELLFPH